MRLGADVHCGHSSCDDDDDGDDDGGGSQSETQFLFVLRLVLGSIQTSKCAPTRIFYDFAAVYLV